MNSETFARGLRETANALKRAAGLEIFSRHRPFINFNGIVPFKTNDTFIAPSAVMIGDVTCWDKSSLWHKAVARADSGHSITIGFTSSIGEGSVLKTLPQSEELETGYPPDTHVGHYVSVGAGCVLKSCRIDDLVIIGDKCTILEGSMIDDHVILEPGSVVIPYQHIPSGQKWGGNPAKFIAPLTADEKDSIQPKAEDIHLIAWEHIVEILPHGYTYVELEELEKKAAEGAK
ncbi:hypothetical protein ACA910_006287 [Epithemia clementina (nom. ined.)]